MKRSKTRYLPVGEVSSGTLRPEDLIPAMLDLLAGVRLSKADRATVCAIERDSGREGYYDEDECDEDFSALYDLANNYAPPYCYVGSTEGDGACIGVWPDVDSLMEDAREWRLVESDRSGGGTRVGDGYRVVVSDHGNVSLYSARTGREFWGVV